MFILGRDFAILARNFVNCRIAFNQMGQNVAVTISIHFVSIEFSNRMSVLTESSDKTSPNMHLIPNGNRVCLRLCLVFRKRRVHNWHCVLVHWMIDLSQACVLLERHIWNATNVVTEFWQFFSLVQNAAQTQIASNRMSIY